MAKKKDQDTPTLEVVRAVAEKIARDNGCRLDEITLPALREALSGSDGYLGAHLQSIRIEATRAARFDTSSLPIQLLSGLCEVIERFQKRGEEIGRAAGKITQELFDQICQRNTALEASVDELERKLADVVLEHKAEELDFNTKMQGAQVEIKSLANNVTSMQQSLADATQKLSEAQYDLGAKTARVEELEKIVSAKDQTINTLNERLAETTNKYTSAAEAANSHKQRADLLNWRSDDLNKEKERLQNELTTANNRAAEAEAELKILNKKAPAPGKQDSSK